MSQSIATGSWTSGLAGDELDPVAGRHEERLQRLLGGSGGDSGGIFCTSGGQGRFGLRALEGGRRPPRRQQRLAATSQSTCYHDAASGLTGRLRKRECCSVLVFTPDDVHSTTARSPNTSPAPTRRQFLAASSLRAARCGRAGPGAARARSDYRHPPAPELQRPLGCGAAGPPGRDGRDDDDPAAVGAPADPPLDARGQVERPRRRRRSATRPAGSLPERTAPRIASPPTRCPTSREARAEIEQYLRPRRRNDCRTEIRCRVRFAGDAAHLRARPGAPRPGADALAVRDVQQGLRAVPPHAGEIPAGALHRPRADLVGEHRQEPRRPEGPVPEGAGDRRRPDRPLSRRLPQHVRRSLGRVRA